MTFNFNSTEMADDGSVTVGTCIFLYVPIA
jgi:hypothetical protein